MVPRCRISGIVEQKKHHPNKKKKRKLSNEKTLVGVVIKNFFYYPAIWMFPIMVVPPFHTPKWSLVGKPMGLLGKPNVLGNTHINVCFF